MRTRNCVIILLTVALTGSAALAMRAAQGNSANSQPPAQDKLSRTRSASCIVRIAVDPAIMPLDPATLQSLLYSSGVAAAAAREALHLESWDNPWETLVEMEWLNESSPRPSPPTQSPDQEAAAYNKQMMQELEKIYGAEYLKQTGIVRDKPDQPAGGSGDSTRPPGTRYRGTRPVPPSPVQSAPGGTPSATIRLSVHLPDGVPPAADGFLRAVISNLRGTLSHAYEVYFSEVNDGLEMARGQYNATVEWLQVGPGPGASKVKQQLERVVDLSALTPEMPLSEAIELLKKSVEPPLNIVVLWRDLSENVQIEPSMPINISGMANVRLETALDLLVRGIQLLDAKVMWRIKGNAVVIATPAALGASSEPAGPPKTGTDILTLTAQKNNLASKLQDLELTLAGQEARRKAIADQIARTETEARARLVQDEVTKELETLVEFSMRNLDDLKKAADAGRASTAELGRATESLTRAKIELAKRREELSKQVGGGQLDQLSSEMGRIAIDRAEKEAQRDIVAKHLAQVQQQLAQASAFDPEAAKMRMEQESLDILARRTAELQTRLANLQRPIVTVIGAN